MAKNKIEDLRNHLFDTLERLLDEENPMDVSQAQAVANVGKVIVESAKVEIEFRKQFGGNGTGFIPSHSEPKQLAINSINDNLSVCATHAAKFGHSKDEAEECDDFSVGCPHCPLKV